MKPYRDKTNRWYVSYEEYNETVYPRYCSGSSYCLTMRAVQPLLDSVKSSPFLWVDDAYITGVLANVANVQRIDTQSLYKFSYEEINKNFFHNPFIFLHLPRTLNRRYAFWKKTLELCNMEDCSR
uniref:Hexosyltransferase n=1 Tax=Trichuris muris TaxID=70415 RepID=A0A5S6QLH5_TRIMR